VLLREKQAEQSKGAAITKKRLAPGWLEKQTRASIAENAMNQTQSGAETMAALLSWLDRAISDDVGGPAPKQLTKD